MDGEGYIAIGLLASFNRIRHITTDLAIVVQALSARSQSGVRLGGAIPDHHHGLTRLHLAARGCTWHS